MAGMRQMGSLSALRWKISCICLLCRSRMQWKSSIKVDWLDDLKVRNVEIVDSPTFVS